MHILQKKKKKREKPVLPEEGRMRRGTWNRPRLRKEAVVSLCFVLHIGLRNSRSRRLWTMTSIFFLSGAACQRKGGRAGGSKYHLAFMEMYQMFQE